MSAPMEARGAHAEVNGTRLYHEVAGVGEPLVLIHGFGSNTGGWDDQFHIFATRYRVIRYDLRGFGKSALPMGESYSHAEDLKALLVHLGVGRAHLLGRSMGGDVALEFALTYPESTGALILQDSTLSGHRWSSEFFTSLKVVRQRAAEAGVEGARELWGAHPLFAPARERSELAARLKQSLLEYSGWHWVNRDPMRVSDVLTAQRLGEVRVPTLVVVGERDLLDFKAIADALAVRIPGARKVVLPGVGHLANMEDPQRFNDVVLEFLADL